LCFIVFSCALISCALFLLWFFSLFPWFFGFSTSFTLHQNKKGSSLVWVSNGAPHNWFSLVCFTLDNGYYF
jgi:hypothetical protein